MKKKISLIIMSIVLMMTFTGCSMDSADELGRLISNHWYKLYLNDDSAKGVKWDDAAKMNNAISHVPKLFDTIEVLEHTEGDFAQIYLRDEDYEDTFEEYTKILVNAGFSAGYLRQEKDKYYRKFYKETESDPVVVIIEGYMPKYSETRNVKIYISISKYNIPV